MAIRVKESYPKIKGSTRTVKNKFVRTKMRPKEGTKIELQRDLSHFVRFVRFSGLDLSDLSDLPIFAI